jgi:hypothetical protein
MLTEHAPDMTLGDRCHMFRFSPGAIAEVIFGHRMNAEHRDQIQGILNNREYDHVQVFEALPGQDEWALQKRPAR